MATHDASTSKQTALDELGRFAAGIAFDHLPDAVVAKAKLCIIDALSACLTIGAREECNQAIALATAIAPSGPAAVFGASLSLPASLAAYVNGTSAACTARSDTHEASSSHPGSVVIPAVLAAAQVRGRSGRAAIEAIVAGYEVWCRIGTALVSAELARVLRPTGLIGAVGAAAGAARAIGLSPQETAHAIGLAAHTVSGLNEWSHCGTTEHVFHSGAAARNAVESALLAAAGAGCAPTLLEGHAGLLAAYGASARAPDLLKNLGSQFEILQITHKPAPACIYAQTPAQAAQRLVREHQITADGVERIRIRVSPAAAAYPGCDNASPIRQAQVAKMSIQFAVASVLVHQGIFDENWHTLSLSAVDRLGAASELIVDATGTNITACRIEIRMRDGRVLSLAQPELLPMSVSDVEERFMQAARTKLGADRADRALDLIRRFDIVDDVTVLADCLQPPRAQA